MRKRLALRAVCTHRGRDERTVELRVEQSLVDVAPDPQEGQLQAVVASGGVGQLLQQAHVPSPGLVQLGHAGQAAPHDVETVARAGLNQRQAPAVGAVHHLHQAPHTLLAQADVFGGVHHQQALVHGQAQLPAGFQGSSQLLGHDGRVRAKRVDVLPDHTEAVAHLTAALHARIDEHSVGEREQVVEELVNGGLHGDVGSAEVEGERGEELVDVRQGAAGQGGVGLLQERAQVSLGEGQEVLEHVCGVEGGSGVKERRRCETSGETAMGDI